MLVNQYIETSLGLIKGTNENVPTTIVVENNSVDVFIEGNLQCYELIEGHLVDHLGYGWNCLEKFLGL